jgi:hypothetical protein
MGLGAAALLMLLLADIKGTGWLIGPVVFAIQMPLFMVGIFFLGYMIVFAIGFLFETKPVINLNEK